MNSTQQMLNKRLKFRSNSLRRVIILLSLLAILVGLQSYAYYSRLEPVLIKANEQFIYLAGERQDFLLRDSITNSITKLRTLSDDSMWQADLDEIQSEFQEFIDEQSENMDIILTQLTSFKNKATTGREIIEQLDAELTQLIAVYHDNYGDIIANLTNPGILYWPTSLLLNWHDGNELLNIMQFNRALYLIIVGEVSAGQAILGQLRTRLPDSPLRARVMFTQGRLLYGMGRFEQSIELVQGSVQLDPELSLAKRFLEYQLSKGPDEEMEEEEENMQRVGTASSGGATIF